MGFVNEQDENGKWRTIDPEKGFVLRKKHGPTRESRYEFDFHMGEITATFAGISRMKTHGVHKAGDYRQYDMNWYFDRLNIKNVEKIEKMEVVSCISSALEAWGWNYKSDRAHSVSVTFKPELLA